MALSFNKVKKAVDVIVNSGHVPNIVGLQGIGKSDLVKEWALEKGYEYEEITCSLLQEGDLAMPYMNNSGTDAKVNYAINEIVCGLVDRCKSSGKKGILFLDEANRPSSNVQSELMNLVLQRRVLNYQLPDCIRIVMAMNPSSEMKGYENSDYSVSFSDAAIMGRILKIDMVPMLSEWLKYGSRLRSDGRPLVHVAVSGYLSQNTKEFVTPETAGEINNTPRGWSRVSDVLYSYEESGINDKQLLYELLRGTLRDQTANSFKVYYLDKSPKVSYIDLARKTLEAESVYDWDPVLGTMNDAELSSLFACMTEYCMLNRDSGVVLNNMVQFILAATNELVYAWATDLQVSYPELYSALVSDDSCAERILGVMGTVKGRKVGGFNGK